MVLRTSICSPDANAHFLLIAIWSSPAMVVTSRNHVRERISMQKNNNHSSPDGKSQDSKRWGSSQGSSGSRSWPISPAGQYDYGRDGNAWIAFDRAGDFVFDEEHLYVGYEPPPRDNGSTRA
jgi:hypothetical protein